MFEYEIYKLKRKYKETISLGELKTTLNRATLLANILLEKAIDDILNTFNTNEHFTKIHTPLFSDDQTKYNKTVEENIRKLLLLAPSKVTSSFVEDIKKEYNLTYHHIKLFKEIMENLTGIRRIYYKGTIAWLYYTNMESLKIKIDFDEENKKFYLVDKDTIKVHDEFQLLNMPQLEKEEIKPGTNNHKSSLFDIYSIDIWQSKYYALKNLIDKLEPLYIEKEILSKKASEQQEKIKLKNNDFFINEEKEYLDISKHFYNPEIIKLYDLSLIDFTNANIAGLDISHNTEVNINFDKIVKDLTNSNINGYNLNKYTLRYFNLTNTDLRNTFATIDIASCIINEEGKMNSGTLFDEDNQFVFHNKELTLNQVQDLGIKIKKLV